MAGQLKISPDQLGDELQKILKEYSDQVIEEMPNLVMTRASATVKELKKEAGKLFGGQKYNRSFKSKKLSGSASKTNYVIYSTEARLTHLLEKGHAIKNQTGMVYGTTQARPHWATAEEHAVDGLEKDITESVKET